MLDPSAQYSKNTPTLKMFRSRSFCPFAKERSALLKVSSKRTLTAIRRVLRRSLPPRQECSFLSGCFLHRTDSEATRLAI